MAVAVHDDHPACLVLPSTVHTCTSCRPLCCCYMVFYKYIANLGVSRPQRINQAAAKHLHRLSDMVPINCTINKGNSALCLSSHSSRPTAMRASSTHNKLHNTFGMRVPERCVAHNNTLLAAPYTQVWGSILLAAFDLVL